MKDNLYNIVLNVLENSPISRGDDFILYGMVCKDLGVDINEKFRTVLANHKQLKLPSFESVSRARRKVFELRPDLNIIKEIRADEEVLYKHKFGKYTD